jgi:hypothetical protein
MGSADVAVDFCFGVEDFAAVWTHVLSCSGLRGAFAFNDLTHLAFTSVYKKKGQRG